MVRGLVIGKFLPPHAGHDHLIRTARGQVDQLVVVVCDLPGQEPPAPLRAAWLAELHPDCEVRTVFDIGHDDDSERWADYTKQFLPGAPDVVFTSEEYGHRWASFLGCRHVCVDPDRLAVPVSGTAVRTEPARHWNHLAAPVRAGLTRRVALVGAESTGTTTLTAALADRFTTVWVPEYGREYSEQKPALGVAPWTTEEFTVIARTQQANEDLAARDAGPVMFCDTDALATAVWHERYVGGVNLDVERIAESRTYAAYVLTGPEIPWVQDGSRDGEHLREWMTGRFRERLSRRDEPWIEVSGDVPTRVEAVIAFLEETLGPEWIGPSVIR